MSALRALLSGMVDYAGLFPPASLPLEDVISNYSNYIQGDDEWMLARIIVPALRLNDFSVAANQQVPDDGGQSQPRWLISALLPKIDDPNFHDAILAIELFNRANSIRSFVAEVDTIEIAASQPADIEQIAKLVPDAITSFIELPHADPAAYFEVLAKEQANRSNQQSKLCAKIRTGGVKPELIPPVEQVADFIIAAKQLSLSFKATAGLHHPLRNEYALTYEDDALRGTMHGFLNVFIGAALINQNSIDRGNLIALLNEPEASEFTFDENSISWRERTIETAAIKNARDDFAISFGSCSFEEPLEDMRQLSLL